MEETNDFKKPFNIFTISLTIVSLIASYFMFKKDKEISFLITDPISLIFDSKNATSTIKIVEKDSIQIKENIYLLTGVIWNSGDVPITETDVRLPLLISLQDSTRILDFKIIKQKDTLISFFELEKIDNNSLKIKWKHFDPKCAFAFQIMCVRKDIPKFELKGKILDIENFNKIHLLPPIWLILFIPLMVFSFLMGIVNAHSVYKASEIEMIHYVLIISSLWGITFPIYWVYNYFFGFIPFQ